MGSETYQNLRLFQRYLLHCRAERALPCLGTGRFNFRRSAAQLLDTISVLLPNSRAEQEMIEARFGAARPTVIVPNAADAATFGPLPEASQPNRDGVLCVGRIEPRKNQLTLIRALRGTGISLTLVGDPGRFSGAYYRRCLRGRCRRPVRQPTAAGRIAAPIPRRPGARLRELVRNAGVGQPGGGLVRVCAGCDPWWLYT